MGGPSCARNLRIELLREMTARLGEERHREEVLWTDRGDGENVENASAERARKLRTMIFFRDEYAM